MSVVYDAGVLVAADRSDRVVWAEHRVRLELGLVPTTTAPVVAQVSRSGRQAQLRRFLRGCEVEALAAADAHPIGELLARTGTADVVDAHVVVVAHRHNEAVVTSDAEDIELLSAAMPRRVEVRPV